MSKMSLCVISSTQICPVQVAEVEHNERGVCVLLHVCVVCFVCDDENEKVKKNVCVCVCVLSVTSQQFALVVTLIQQAVLLFGRYGRHGYDRLLQITPRQQRDTLQSYRLSQQTIKMHKGASTLRSCEEQLKCTSQVTYRALTVLGRRW
jgi:hypothetical protein